MLELLTTEAFAEWFAAEDVATVLDVIERLGPARAAPGSRESLLWYEHPSVSRFLPSDSLAWELEAWGCFRDYAKQILAALEAPRLAARLSRLGSKDAAQVLRNIEQIRRAADPRLRWTLKLVEASSQAGERVRPEDACSELRRLYLGTLDAAGFASVDVPAHSLALREISRRRPGPSFRVLYGVHAERERALLVLGERLGRSYYGDSVRRAERLWDEFLRGSLPVEPAQPRER